MKSLIPQAMAWKYGAKCSKNITGDGIDTWEHPTLPKPNLIQILQDLEEYKTHLQKTQYREERAKAYEPVGEQLDRITKSLAFLKSQGVEIGPEGQAQVSMSDSVKGKFPKN